MNVVMVGLRSREAGLAAMDRIDWAVEEGRIAVDDMAMACRDEKGKVKIQQTADATAGKGALKGGAVGLLVGIFAAPLVAATAAGAGIGALVGKARDKGVSDKLMKQARRANRRLRGARVRARRRLVDGHDQRRHRGADDRRGRGEL